MEDHIRPAIPDDFGDITAIYRDAVLLGTASYEIAPPPREEMLARFRAVREKRLPYLVAAVDGRIAGFAYLDMFRPRPAYRYMVEDSIYLDPAFHRRGIGRRLLESVIEFATNEGYRQIVAVIGDSTANRGSVGLHRALGFRTCGTIEDSGFKHGRWLDTLILQRSLNGGNSTLPDPADR